MKKNLFFAGVGALFAFMLFFPAQSFAGARSGLLLWYETLVPTLFPVMICSRILLDTGLAGRLAGRIARPFTLLLGLSPHGVYALLTGFLCGCPMGAKVLMDLRAGGRISRAEAAYLGKFINNISPAFVSGYLVLQHLSRPMLAPTLCILFGAPLLYGLFSNHRFREEQRASREPAETPAPLKNKAPATVFSVVDACITDSISGITKLGGYVILFSVLSSMADTLAGQFPLLRALLLGVTEVSGGIHCIAGLALPFTWKYLLLTAAASFGGLCCAAQSAQMLSRAGIPLRSYLGARLGIAAIAVIMAFCYAA